MGSEGRAQATQIIAALLRGRVLSGPSVQPFLCLREISWADAGPTSSSWVSFHITVKVPPPCGALSRQGTVIVQNSDSHGEPFNYRVLALDPEVHSEGQEAVCQLAGEQLLVLWQGLPLCCPLWEMGIKKGTDEGVQGFTASSRRQSWGQITHPKVACPAQRKHPR